MRKRVSSPSALQRRETGLTSSAAADRLGITICRYLYILIAVKGCTERGRSSLRCPGFVGAREKGLVRATDRELSRHRLWIAVHRELRREPRVQAVTRFLRDIAPDLLGGFVTK